uniref:BTB domain-containing protein n=1 Tax=Melopsittacus undulatus TaxID=13146 RepID=A0A8V5GMU7_MELUD
PKPHLGSQGGKGAGLGMELPGAGSPCAPSRAPRAMGTKLKEELRLGLPLPWDGQLGMLHRLRSFAAHKAVLACAAGYFQNLFLNTGLDELAPSVS